jgi:hypothetical protein
MIGPDSLIFSACSTPTPVNSGELRWELRICSFFIKNVKNIQHVSEFVLVGEPYDPISGRKTYKTSMQGTPKLFLSQ